MLLVSIIIPIYNTETYLRRCLDSIVCQTYNNLEILLVDDGSTDNSPAICDEYSAMDARIGVIHQENKGSSITKKSAVERVKGDYVLMVDSDDWIEKNMVEKMLTLATEKGLDIVWCDVMIQKQDTRVVHNIFFNSSPSRMLNTIYAGRNHGWLWNKLIRRSLYDGLVAYKDNMYEDVFFETQLLLKNPKMGYIAEPYYNYNRTNPLALTNEKDVAIKAIPNIMNCYDYLVAHNLLEDYKNSFYRLVLEGKFALVHNKKYLDAQTFLPSAHVNIKNYPVNMPYSIIYWIGLNFGVLGRLCLNFYETIRQLKKQLRRL